MDLPTNGMFIFLDRYAVKDHSAHVDIGSNVVCVVDEKRRVPGIVVGNNGTRIDVRLHNGNGVSQTFWDTANFEDPKGFIATHVDLVTEKYPDDMISRVARAVANVEKDGEVWYQRFASAIGSWRFVPAGRILSSMGAPDVVTTPFNCFALPPPHDSRKGINKTLEIMTEIMCRGGGVGIPIMTLRPRGARVRSINGRSSGSVSWAEEFSYRTGRVEQGGSRRGATILVQYCWHPDIKEFIKAKSSGESFEHANLSVALTDKFMDAVKHDREWDLVFPNIDQEGYNTEWNGDIDAWVEKGYSVDVWDTIGARELWHLLAEYAWKRADPGVLFIDRMQAESTCNYYEEGKIFGCNPCQPLWAPLMTPRGISDFRSVAVGDIIWSGKRWTRVAKKVMSGVKPVYAWRTKAGTFYGTENHRVLQRGRKIQVCKASSIDLSPMPFSEGMAPEDLPESVGIQSVRYIGDEPVCDIGVDDPDHVYWTDGLSVSNCGEQPMPNWGACNLGALNLPRFVTDGKVNHDLLTETVETAVRFLDDVIDIANPLLPEIDETQKADRRIGLGTMGLGEMLFGLKMRYGSEESLDFAGKLFRHIAEAAYRASVNTAREKGAFPRCRNDAHANTSFVKRLDPDIQQSILEHGIRNVAVVTQPPTGSIGTMVETSTGIEPYYSLAWTRQTLLGTIYEIAAPVKKWLVESGYTPEQIESLARDNFKSIRKDMPDYFVGATEITPEAHAQMQATIQKWTDSSISKTANLPNNYTVEDVANYYQLIYDLGCKGGTVCREGSLSEPVLTAGTSDGTEAPKWELLPILRNVGESLDACTETPVGELITFIRVNEKTLLPFDTLSLASKSGSDVLADIEGLGRLISVILRMNSPIPILRRVEIIIKHLRGIGGKSTVGFGPEQCASLPDGLAMNLQKILKKRYGADADSASPVQMDICPECGAASFEKGAGCGVCRSCGYDAC